MTPPAAPAAVMRGSPLEISWPRCAARAERYIADGTRGGTAGEQTGDKGEEKQFGCVGDEFDFHNG